MYGCCQLLFFFPCWSASLPHLTLLTRYLWAKCTQDCSLLDEFWLALLSVCGSPIITKMYFCCRSNRDPGHQGRISDWELSNSQVQKAEVKIRSRIKSLDEDTFLVTPEDLRVNLPRYPRIWQNAKEWVVFTDFHVSKRTEQVSSSTQLVALIGILADHFFWPCKRICPFHAYKISRIQLEISNVAALCVGAWWPSRTHPCVWIHRKSSSRYANLSRFLSRSMLQFQLQKTL